ncbi:hypothetical protein CO151_01465 [bacterium CG_4_9_14_3_um_filter_65_15]|nr:MAG: hypothetical protein CO151_01465 [bacterium CG_4_9_14_3_um_filter_65_15]
MKKTPGNGDFRLKQVLVRRSLPWALSGLVLVGAGCGLVLFEHGFSARMEAAVLLILLGFLSLAIVPVGILTAADRAGEKLRDLGVAMQGVARGDFERRLEIEGWDEVAQVRTEFNRMADDLQESQKLVRDKTAQLLASLAELKRLDQTKHDVLTLISHEIRTPLTAIKGGMEYLRASTGDVPADQRSVLESYNLFEILDIIGKNTSRLDRFMNDAMIMANLQSFSKRLTVTPAPARNIIGGIMADLAPRTSEMGLEVRNEVQDDQVWDLLGDVEILSIALEKVLENAVSHNAAGGRILIRQVDAVPGLGTAEVLRTKIGGAGRDPFPDETWHGYPVRWRLLEVYNTGAPIPQDRRTAMFSLFEMVGPMAHHQRGSGLSLPIVKVALERAGGGIFVASGEEEGNSFYLLLPTLDHALGKSTRPTGNLWDEAGQGFGGIPGDEDINPWGQETGLEVELAHAGPPTSG